MIRHTNSARKPFSTEVAPARSCGLKLHVTLLHLIGPHFRAHRQFTLNTFRFNIILYREITSAMVSQTSLLLGLPILGSRYTVVYSLKWLPDNVAHFANYATGRHAPHLLGSDEPSQLVDNNSVNTSLADNNF
jgi:hypothetical protein